jgi:hypothetical protein
MASKTANRVTNLIANFGRNCAKAGFLQGELMHTKAGAEQERLRDKIDTAQAKIDAEADHLYDVINGLL